MVRKGTPQDFSKTFNLILDSRRTCTIANRLDELVVLIVAQRLLWSNDQRVGASDASDLFRGRYFWMGWILGLLLATGFG